ncbi:PepSY domain-containing protein [Fretibacter rubidus]|uniref:PepSY domain-containing protein n=1 Tax=Fretibacter rubidus TaxID=570162 RepID=UPI00352B3A16
MAQVKTYLFATFFAGLASVSMAMPAFAVPTDVRDTKAAVTFNVSDFAEKPVQFVQSAISASKAKSIARRAVPGGEVVDISRKGNRYTVRMIRKDGRVVDIVIDARTGRVLN